MLNNETKESLEKLDNAIAAIMESDRRIKELEKKIAEKKRLLRETNTINIGDLGLLPLIL